MIDANQLPITEEKDDAILAKKLQMFTTSPLYIKHSKSRIPLSSQIYALKKNSAEINKNLNLWFKTEEYTALHHLFSQKEELTDSHKRLHLLKASQKGDLSTINALLKN